MKKSIIVVALLFFSGFAYSQTTVTLQDQCNCEVLSGTAVSSPGVTTPSGADAGDIYVNTNTGTIYFWDGDSWELTATDDQQLTGFTFNGATNELTLTLENGGSVNVDLSSLSDTLTDTNTTITSFGIDGTNTNLVITDSDTNTYAVALADIAALVNTDDQTAAEVTYDNATSGLTATDTQAAIDEVASGSTDDQNIESLGVDLGTNVLTVGIENGTSQTVDLSHLDDAGTDDQTASEVNITDAGGNFTATEVEGALAELAAGSTDDQNIESLGVDTGTNILTVGIENGTSQTVDLSHLDDAGTDDQTASEVNITDAGGNFTATEVEGALAELAAGSTDDQNIESLGVDLGTNVLTVGIENGTSQTVDLSHLDDAGTDDQTAAEVTYDNTTSGLTATDTQAAIDQVAAGSTDDQNIESLGVDLGTNVLTVGIENGTSQTVDLSHLDDAGTDDQTAAEVTYDNTTSGLTATDTQAAIDEVAAGSTDDQNIESLGVDVGTNVLTVGIENGTSQTVDLSHLDDAGTDDQTASEVNITDAGGNFTATEVEGALAELAAGSTDDQNIESLGVDLGTNVLTVGIENGTSQTVDLSHLDDAGTDDQTAAEVTYDNTTSGLTATDTQAAIDEVAAGSTDDQNIESLGVDLGTNVLTVGIENGTSQTVDLSHLDDAGTDDQTASEVNITDAGGNFTATEVEGALAELAAGSTDDQNIESLGVDLGTNILTVGIENGTSQTVDLSHLDDAGTDDQNIESLGVDVGTNVLTVGIENGTSQTVDLSHLDDAGTDDQTASEVNITDAGGNFTATEVEGALAELAAGSTDDQNIESLGVDTGTNILTVGIEDGTSQTVDLSHLDDAGTDDQNIESLGVDVGTNVLTVGIENGTSQTVDLSHLDDAGTDDQNIESLGVDLGTNVLTVGIENGTSQTVDLSHLDDAGTDDQTASEVNITDAGGNFTATEVEGALAELAAGSTDDQNIESLGVDLGTNVLTVGIENGTSQTVDLSHLDDAGTDDQNIESLGVDLGTNVLTVGIENGTSQTVDLSHLDDAGTDDQTASEVNITDAGGNFTATEVEGALAELAAGSTDDQNIESLGVDLGTNILTVGIENGTSQTVDLSHLDDAGTDDQTIDNFSIVGGELNISLEDDGVAPSTVDLISANANNDISSGTDGGLYLNVASVSISETITTLADNLDGTYTYTSENGTPTTFTGTDDQIASEVNITDAGGNFTATEVEGALAELAAGSTDDQNIESLGVDVGTNVLTVGIENGTSQTVDLSHLDDAGTDDQTAAEVTYDNTTSGLTATDTQAAIDEVAAGSTDDQNIENLGVDLGTNVLTVGIENGTSQTVDLSHLDDAGTDDQTAAEVNITDAGGNFTATEVEGALAELAAGSTDDQNIESLGVDVGTNILTVGIEDGTSQTVDLSHLDDAGTDDQTAAEVTYDNTTSGLTATDTQAAIDEVAAGSTDDQNIESLGVDVGTNVLTVGIENGTSQTVDLSHLDDAGTDDQTASEVNITDAGGNFTATEVEGALAELAAGITDDQNIESLGVDVGTNVLTVGIENGTSQTVDLSHLDDAGTDDQTAAEVTYDNTTSGLTATDTQAAIDEVAAGSTDDQNIESLGVDVGTNVLTVGIENGTSQTVDLSHLDDAGTDDQTAAEVTYDNTTSGLTATDTQAAIDEVAAGSTDNQNIESLGVDVGTNVLTVGIENGTSQTVDLSHLDDAGTDDQTAAEVTYDNTTSGLTATDTQAAIDEVAAGSTDDQNIESLGVDLGTNVLTVGIEDGTSQTVDLSHLDDAGTDDQNIESLGVDLGTNVLTVGIENGTSQTVDLSHLDDAGTDDQTAAEVNITDAGGNFTATEVEGALAELAAGSTDDQNIESLGVDTGTNILTVGIENGTSQTVDLSHLDDAGTDDQTAAEVTYDNTTSGLTATDTQAAIDEVAAGSTDDQNIESLGVDVGTNVLTVGIENGTSQTVDLSHLDDAGTDDQNIESLGVDVGTNILTVGIEDGTSQTVDLSHLDDAGTDDQNIESLGVDVGTNILTVGIEDGTSQTVDLSHLDDAGTDDQNIESLGVDLGTNVLTVGIENGTSQTVDLSHLDDAGTDDQTASEVNITDAGGNFTATEVEGALAELAAGSTDDQNIESLGVDVGTNVLTVGIENGTSQTVDLSHLDDAGTDDQTASEVNITDAGGNFTATEVEGALAELAAGSTDDQNIESLGVDVGTNILTVGIEDGTSQTVDLSHLDDAGTDDQNIESLGVDVGTNVLTVGIENGTSQTVDLSHLDDAGTDDQTASEVNITDAGGNFTATEVEGALAELAAGSTDDQNIESLGVDLGTNVLTVGIENGTSQTVDLSHLDDAGTDDQTASEVNITDAGGNFTATEVEGALAELAAGSTDDQNIESLGVDVGTNVLTVGIENGTSQTVDLSHLDDAGTDDQTAAEVTYDNTTSGLTATDTQAAIDEVAAGSTDDQNIESLGVDVGTNILTVGIENGTSQTVDLSHLDDAGTDDQTAAEVNITDAGGNFTATEVEGALAELAAGSTDDQNIESLGVDVGTNILTVGIEDGTSQTVDLSHLDDVGTDDQNIESLGVDLGTNVLTVGIENGTSQTVDLSHLDDAGTDDQTAAEVNITDAGGNFTATEVEGALAELAAGSTDDQNIESLGVDTGTNILTVGIENGTSQTVDLSHLDDAGTDDQTASEVNITDAGGNFTATEVEGALAELAAGSTDDQNIESLGVDVGTNILTVGIEDGTSQTVDLSHLDDAGTDDQTAAEVTYDNTTSGLTATDTQAAIDEVAAGSTDDQNIESLGVDLGTNVLTVGIEDGTSQTVDLSHLDDAGTDDQTAAEVTYDNTTSGLTATDTQAAIDEVAAGSTDDQNIESLGVDVGTNVLTVGIENGTSQTVDLSHLDDAGTDDQNIESLGVDLGTNVLTVGIENGTSQTVDLSHLDDAGTDDQTAAEVTYDNTTSGLTATDTQAAIDEVAAGSTDDQNIESLGVDLGTNVLTVGIEDGISQTVDLSHLDDAGTDDQNIESLGVDLGTNVLTVGIENGTSQTVDLSHLDDPGTDDQTAAEVTYDNTTSGLTATDTQAAIDEVAAGSTDDQNIESLGVDLGTNVLTVGIEDGTSQTVDLSHLDDAGTDDQNIESLGVDLGTNVLTVGIENGTSQTVDLSHLDDAGTDDQTASEVNITDAGGNFTATEVEGALAELAAGSTDDQNIESLGVDVGTNILTVGIEDGTSQTVDLSHLDDAGTDDQNIESLGVDLGTNVLTVGIENGTSQTVDLSHLDDAGTDDQTASEVNIIDAGGNFTATEVEGALAELASQTDDDVSVTNTVTGNRIASISEPGIVSVDINETVTSLSQNTTTGVISYTDEDGGAAETANVVSTDANNELTVGADGGASFEMTDIDVDGDGAAETTVDEAMADIAKITATAGRIFYPPSIAVDASTTGIKNIDLYQEYLDQFGTPTAGSSGAPVAIPTYARTDLYYYVTYADPTVFETDSGDPNFMTIDANGNLTIEVENLPTDYNSLINVVFVVK
ncbi:hypothetical protein [Flagellimonas sp. 2504JD1-5]